MKRCKKIRKLFIVVLCITLTAGITVNAAAKVSSKKVKKVKLSKSSVTLTSVGGCAYLTAVCTPISAKNRKVTWSSSNQSVARVNNAGKVTAASVGTAIITAAAKDGSGKKASCKITVTGVSSSTAKSRRISILMIGNSLTKYRSNNTAEYLKGLARSAGRKVSVTRLTHNNEKLSNWANRYNTYGKKAYAKIAGHSWDYIVLQEQTNEVIAGGGTFVSASKTLASYIREKCPDATIVYNSTWAWDRTVFFSGKRYTKSAQQTNMKKNCRLAASATGGGGKLVRKSVCVL